MLPESVRTREYVVTLASDSQHPQSVFVARPVEGSFDAFLMRWTVSDKETAMVAASGDGGEIPGIVERLGSGERLQLAVYSGPVEITAAASISVPVVGSVSYCRGTSGCTTCWSDGRPHQLTMTRR